MSQRGFGKLLGVSATAVQLWEKGETVPATENLAQEELLNYLDAKPLPEPSDVHQILKHIKSMPLSQVAIIVRAVAESSGSWLFLFVLVKTLLQLL